MSMINGVISNNVVYSYRLQPYRTGTLTIEPVKLTLNGQTYLTNPINIEVSQGSGQIQAPSRSQQDFKAPSSLGNNDVFVEAFVDNAEPKIGEQTNYIFRYYEALDAMRLSGFFGGGQPDYEPPALTGFWAEGDIDVTSYRVSANGRIYTVTELTQALFPTAAGEQTIDPARITISSNGLRNDTVLDTEPVVVDVQPMPAGAPESFTGAVGQYDIRAALDKDQTQVDEPVTLKVTVEGVGNISTATDPAWPEIDGWRIFDADSSLNTQVENGLVSGSHTYERLMVPTTAGQFIVPSIEYTYFDPSLDQYVTVATDSMAINVAPGVGAPGPIMAAGASITADEPVVLTADDIDPVIVASLKPVPMMLETVSPPLTTETWYWLLWGVPLAALAGGFVWQRRQTHLEQNAGAVRSSRARKQALKAIAQARKEQAKGQGGNPDQFVAAGNILTEYLSAKLHMPVAGKTNQAIADAMSQQGADDELIRRSLNCLDSHEHNLYSPAGVAVATPTQLLDEAEALVDELDGVL